MSIYPPPIDAVDNSREIALYRLFLAVGARPIKGGATNAAARARLPDRGSPVPFVRSIMATGDDAGSSQPPSLSCDQFLLFTIVSLCVNDVNRVTLEGRCPPVTPLIVQKVFKRAARGHGDALDFRGFKMALRALARHVLPGLDTGDAESHLYGMLLRARSSCEAPSDSCSPMSRHVHERRQEASISPPCCKFGSRPSTSPWLPSPRGAPIQRPATTPGRLPTMPKWSM